MIVLGFLSHAWRFRILLRLLLVGVCSCEVLTVLILFLLISIYLILILHSTRRIPKVFFLCNISSHIISILNTTWFPFLSLILFRSLSIRLINLIIIISVPKVNLGFWPFLRWWRMSMIVPEIICLFNPRCWWGIDSDLSMCKVWGRFELLLTWSRDRLCGLSGATFLVLDWLKNGDQVVCIGGDLVDVVHVHALDIDKGIFESLRLATCFYNLLLSYDGLVLGVSVAWLWHNNVNVCESIWWRCMLLLYPDRRRGTSLVMIVKHVHALPLNFKLGLSIVVVAILGTPRKQVPPSHCRLLVEIAAEPLFGRDSCASLLSIELISLMLGALLG